MQTISGKIAAILDRSTVVINQGSADGVALNDIFYIYSELGPFKDPDTGEELGKTKKIWGKVRVSVLESRFCIAVTDYALTDPNILQGIFGPRIQLPVDEVDIMRGLTMIKVGFPVISQRYSQDVSGNMKALPKPTEVKDPNAVDDTTSETGKTV